MVREVDVDELQALLSAGAALIDVRMPDEYEQARVPGAALIPLPQLPERLGEVPDDVTVYVICHSGARSANACQFLASQGYEAVNVAGGTAAWIDSGRGIESDRASG